MQVSTHTKSVNRLLGRLKFPAALLLVLFLFDLSFDIREKDKPEHLLVEVLIYLTISYLLYIGYRFYRLDKKALDAASKDINATHQQLASAEHRNKLLQEGINVSMAEAFASWKLTQAEQDIAVLIVKGFSLGEIAKLRGTSERTIRDQAASVYHKAKLKNRIELTAFFVEDLL